MCVCDIHYNTKWGYRRHFPCRIKLCICIATQNGRELDREEGFNGNPILFIIMSLLQQNYLVSPTKIKGFTPPGFQQQLLSLATHLTTYTAIYPHVYVKLKIKVY